MQNSIIKLSFRNMGLAVFFNADIEVDIQQTSDGIVVQPDLHIAVEKLLNPAEIPVCEVFLRPGDQLDCSFQDAECILCFLLLFIQRVDFLNEIRVLLQRLVRQANGIALLRVFDEQCVSVLFQPFDLCPETCFFCTYPRCMRSCVWDVSRPFV